MPQPSDQELLELIIAADDEALREGSPPKARFLPVTRKVMMHLGYDSYVMLGTNADPIARRIMEVHESLYRPSDLAIGGIHGGIFMFRDIFARVDIPISYGRVRVDPLKLTDLSPQQVKWLCSRPHDLQMYLDQFIDIFDFAGGIGNLANFKTPPKDASDIFYLAAFQLQAAAAALSVAFDFRGAVQSALIGAELALKGGLAAVGVHEKSREKHKHNLGSAATAFFTLQTNFDMQRILAAIKRLPRYVENRYSPSQPSRVETGHIVMGAQYIAGEVMRQVTRFSIRPSLTPAVPRTYPSLE